MPQHIKLETLQGMSNKQVGFQLSIVTSCYTTERLPFLECLLSSISNQSFKDFEIIIVVDGSESLHSQVKALATRFNLYKTKVLRSLAPGASACRNLGAQSTSAQIVGFVDDDVILDKSWAEAVLLFFRRTNEASGLVGSARPIWMEPKDSWFPVPLRWIVSCTDWFEQRTHEVTNMWTMNCAVKREHFLVCGGFRHELGPRKGREAGYFSLAEDYELSRRLRMYGHRIFFVPSAKCFHHVQHSQVEMRYVVNRSVWIGRERKRMTRLGENLRVEAFTLTKLLTYPLHAEFARHSITDQARAVLAIAISLTSVMIGILS